MVKVVFNGDLIIQEVRKMIGSNDARTIFLF